MRIQYVDTDGTKDSLPEGHLGYDKATADRGRVAVGTNTGDVLLAKKSEVDSVNTRVDSINTRVSAIEDNTTIADYGIKDAYTKTEVDTKVLALDNSEAAIAYAIALG